MFIIHLWCNTTVRLGKGVCVSLGNIVVVSGRVVLASVGGVAAVPGLRVESAVGSHRVVVLAHNVGDEEVDWRVCATAGSVLLPVSVVSSAG